MKSKLTSAGYIMMLVIRLSGELVFITAERELAKHQSGVQCGLLDYSVFFVNLARNLPKITKSDRKSAEITRKGLF